MALVPGVSEGALVELDVGNSAESLTALLNSQRELFHSQIEQLQKLVVAQCKLTGVNPLSQEMAAGALSIKIGKKPRDLLNPKAVNYMQSIFSVKDAVGKKETREISALCGVTVTQVREFFAGQRSRVRKFVRLSRDKATRVDASRASSNGCSLSSEQCLPVSEEALASSADNMMIREQIPVPGNAMIISTVTDGQHDTTDLKKVEEGPSCTALEETVPGIDTNDQKFLDNIFNLMRKEETFSGQVKLMEWVLQIHNSAVLIWFLTKGGLTILSTWLSQAALEEQTTVLLVIFKVLCHLPLHKALPVQMSAVLQTVNRLRFYRTSDISNRARTLLSRWSKLFVRSQALKKPLLNSSKDSQKEIVRKQRISEILSDESWQSKIDIPEDILSLTEDMEKNRKSESKQALKLLPASSDELSKKHGRSVSLPKTKERRKVLLVERPDHKPSGRSVQLARAAPSNHSRPMSADDIQKAKMRAMFMQNKYGKADTSNSENKPPKTEDGNHVPSPSQTSNMLCSSRIPQLPPLRKDEETKPSISTTNILPKKQDTLVISKPNTSSQEQLLEKLKCSQIQWQTPPVVILDSTWCVGVGENSKEVEVQMQRNRREKESFYSKPQDIPLDPKEPWDLEMDFDDSLTLEIPIEPSPDADIIEDSSCSPCSGGASNDETPATTSAPPINNGNPEPDLELLAVLLKNPDLVFALTSGKGKSMTSEEMVVLLDMLKKNGVGLTELMNGAADGPKEKPKEPEPTSLPSPTPPSDPAARASWKSEFPTRNAPVLQPHFRGSRVASAALPSATPQNPSPAAVPPMVVKTQTAGLGLPQTSTTILSVPELTVTINPTSQHHPPHNFLPKRPPTSSAHQMPNSIYPLQHNSVPDHILPTKQCPVTNVPIASPSVPQQESFNHNPSPITLSALLPISSRQQSHLLAEPPKVSPKIPRWPPVSATIVGRPNPTPDPWIGVSNGFSEVGAPNVQFFANQNNYNAYPKGPVQQPAVPPRSAGNRNEILDRTQLETWSPEGSPVRLSAFRGGQKFSDARRDHGRNHRPEWSRQWDSGNRDHYRTGSNRRWRDRVGDRRR
ncbi:homeobox protein LUMINIDEPENDENS [Elaeis guineensis]|uniref:homeobox protein LUMINIDEPENDENS n=1 Tax=Elaeis guineensis var. tenera TaxID=51953 RepID=UPI003C6CC524